MTRDQPPPARTAAAPDPSARARDLGRRTVGAVAPAVVLAVVQAVVHAPLAAGAQPPPLAPTHPLTVADGRPAGLELAADVPGGWTLAVTTAYGNTFRMSDDVHRAHVAIDGAGAPLSPDALEIVPDHGTQHAVDAELVLVTLEAAGPIGDRWLGGVRLPWWRLGGTSLDPLPRRWHDLLGIADAGRPLYPDGDTVVWLRSGGNTFEASRTVSTGIGDATAWFGRRWRFGASGVHRLWLAATVPTGTHPLLDGDDLQFGLRWSAAGRIGRWRLSGGAGVTAGTGDTPLGGRRRTTGHGWIGAGLELGRDVVLWVAVRGDGSPYGELHGPPADESTAQLAAALDIPVGGRHRVQLAFGEDLPDRGFVPDFSVQLRWLAVLP